MADLLNRFISRLGEQVPEEFRFLTRTFNELRQEHPDSGPEVVWPIIDRSESLEGEPAGGLKLVLGGKASASLHIQALAPLPKGVEQAPDLPSGLRLSAAGSLAIQGEGALNAAPVSISMESGAEGSASLEFHFRHEGSLRVAQALAANLAQLGSPFSVKALQRMLLQQDLAAVTLDTQHKLRFGGSIGFADAFQLASGIPGTVEASFGFHMTESGDFSYLAKATEDGKGISIRLRRKAKDSDEYRQSLAVGLDLTGWAEKVYPLLKGKLGEAGVLIGKIESFLPGGEDFNQALGTALTEALAGSPYEQPLHTLLGADDDKTLSAMVEEELLSRLDSAAEIWGGRAEETARDLAEELARRLRLSDDLKSGFIEKAGEGLQDGLQRLHEGLREKLKELVRGNGFKPLANTLNGLGHGIKETITGINNRLEAVTGPVLKELEKLRRKIAELERNYLIAADAKIQLKFNALSREENAEALDLEFIIDPDTEGAQEALDRLLTGDIQQLMHTQPGAAVTAIKGRYARYADLDTEQGFNAVLLGFGFSGATLMDIDNSMVVDAQGNIQVLSRLEWIRQYKHRDEERQLNIVDAFELATAGRTRSINLSINLSLNDEKLRPKEAKRFFESAELAGLLPAGASRRAMEMVDADTLRAGRLDIGMSLTKPQLLRLLQLENRDASNTEPSAFDTGMILSNAAANIARIVQQQPHDKVQLKRLKGLREELAGFDIDLGDNLAQMISRTTRRKVKRASGYLEGVAGLSTIEAENDLSWVLARRIAVTGCHGECIPRDGREQDGLADALRTMREIYLSGEWEIELYRDKQRAIGEAFKIWSYWGHEWKWWLFNSDRIRPLTLALFKTIADLAQPHDAAEDLLLHATLTLKETNGKKKRMRLA
jgi:hypothetical protein